jgi:hypothetical protein
MILARNGHIDAKTARDHALADDARLPASPVAAVTPDPGQGNLFMIAKG